MKTSKYKKKRLIWIFILLGFFAKATTESSHEKTEERSSETKLSNEEIVQKIEEVALAWNELSHENKVATVAGFAYLAGDIYELGAWIQNKINRDENEDADNKKSKIVGWGFIAMIIGAALYLTNKNRTALKSFFAKEIDEKGKIILALYGLPFLIFNGFYGKIRQNTYFCKSCGTHTFFNKSCECMIARRKQKLLANNSDV